MKYLALLASTMLLPVAAQAQQAPATPPAGGAPAAGAGAAASATPTVGATVFDPQGAAAGTVDSITPQAIVINTGTNKVGVPPSAVGSGPKGLLVSLTKAQLDAAFQQQAAQSGAQLQSKLVPGAQVFGSGGAQVGTVKAADPQFVTLTTAKGDVKLPATGFAAGPNGLVIGMTAAQLDAAITQAGGAAPANGTATSADAGAAGAVAGTAQAPGTTATATNSATGGTVAGTTGGATSASVGASADAAANSGAPDNATAKTGKKKGRKQQAQ